MQGLYSVVFIRSLCMCVCVCEPLLGVIQPVTERLLTELSALIKDSSAVAAEWRERERERYLIHLGALVLPSWTGADLTLTSSAVEATTPSTSEPQDRKHLDRSHTFDRLSPVMHSECALTETR